MLFAGSVGVVVAGFGTAVLGGGDASVGLGGEVAFGTLGIVLSVAGFGGEAAFGMLGVPCVAEALAPIFLTPSCVGCNTVLEHRVLDRAWPPAQTWVKVRKLPGDGLGDVGPGAVELGHGLTLAIGSPAIQDLSFQADPRPGSTLSASG